jgi:hypothetical protein
MLPANYNFSLARGKTFSRKFVQKAGTPAVAVDLTGWKVRAEFRELDGQYGNTASSSLLLALPDVDGNGLTLSDAVNGEISLYLSAANTLLLDEENEPTQIAYEIELYNDDDPDDVQVQGFLTGVITVVAETARAASP